MSNSRKPTEKVTESQEKNGNDHEPTHTVMAVNQNLFSISPTGATHLGWWSQKKTPIEENESLNGLAVCLLGSSRRMRILTYLANHEDQIIKTAEIRRICRTNTQGYHRLFLELERYGLMSKSPISDHANAQRRWAVEPHPTWAAIRTLLNGKK